MGEAAPTIRGNDVTAGAATSVAIPGRREDVGRVPTRLGLLGTAVRVVGHVLREKVTRPVAVDPDDVPCSVEAITPEWLGHVVRPAGSKARLLAIEPGAGSSGTSVRRQLRLVWDDEGTGSGLPESVFVKTSPGVFHRVANGISGTLVAEAGFYRDVRPELRIEAPLGYGSRYDLRSLRCVHVLEDLVTTKGATFCTPQTLLERRQAEDMVGLLATLHGTFYGAVPAYSWLRTYPEWFRMGERVGGLETWHERGFEAARSVVPRDLYTRLREIWPATVRAVELHRRLPETLLHSDVHLGNWYVTNQGRMGLCDWQCLASGHGSRDFAYAVASALTIEQRRAWERDLLGLYLERLAEAGGPKPGFDETWLRYRQQTLPALLMWTPVLRHSRLLPDMQPESVSLEMIRRISTAIADLDALESMNEG